MRLMGLKYSKAMLFSIKVGLAALLVWILMTTGILDLRALRSLFNTPATLLTVIFLCLAMYVLSVFRWQILLSCQEIRISFQQATKLVFLSLFLNCFLPGGGFGGDAVRMAYITKVTRDRKTEAVLSVFFDRALGLYALITIGAVASCFLLHEIVDDPVLIFLAGAAISATLGIPLVVGGLYVSVRQDGKVIRFLTSEPRGGIRNTLLRIANSAALYIQTPSRLFHAFVISIGIQMLMVAGMMSLGRAMDLVGMTAVDYAFATLWGTLSNLLPLTPGGLGVGEAAFGSVSYLLIGGHSGIGVATVFLVYRLLSMVATLPGLLIWFFSQDTARLLTRSPETT